MKLSLATAATAGITLVLAGCGGGTPSTKVVTNPIPTATAVRTVVVTETAVSTPPLPATQTPSRTTNPSQVALGDTVKVSTAKADYKVSALEVKTDVASGNRYEKPKAGNQYVGLLVQFCLDRNDYAQDLKVSSFPWSLHYASGAVIDSSTFLSSSPGVSPAYPDNAIVPVGTCAKGWIIYEGPAGQRPNLIVYANEAGGRALTFTVPK